MNSATKSALVLALALLGLASQAQAALAPLTYSPTPADLGDLDHHLVYSWRIDNINLTNVSVTGATLSFKNISNWDSNPNMLFVWLMDTAVNPGVATIQDVDPSQAPVTTIVDAFLSTNSLVSASTAKSKLFEKSFTTTGTDYTYSFTTAQLQTLMNYINNGQNIAFGFDPDCHFFNDGITFTLNVTPIPEAATFVPALLVLGSAIALEVRRRRAAARCAVRV